MKPCPNCGSDALYDVIQMRCCRSCGFRGTILHWDFLPREVLGAAGKWLPASEADKDSHAYCIVEIVATPFPYAFCYEADVRRLAGAIRFARINTETQP